MRRYFRSSLPPAIAGSILLAAVVVLVIRAERRTAGHYVYPLDDTYIHMAIAKNLALHGVWGTSQYHFGSLSSSPLWTLILALGFRLMGLRELLPLILCTLLSVLVLIVVDWIARRQGMATWVRLTLLLLIVAAAPLPTLSVLGMEHVLQILADVIFLYLAATIACDIAPQTARQSAWLAASAALVCMSRYEGLFLVAAAATALLIRRRMLPAIGIVLGGILPVVLLAVFSVRHGGLWLPNSVLLKGHHLSFGSLNDAASAVGGHAFEMLTYSPPLFASALLALGVLIISKLSLKSGNVNVDVSQTMLLMAIITTALHAQFADLARFFRYESYLIVLLMLSITLTLSHGYFAVAAGRAVGAWMRMGLTAGGIAAVLWPLSGRARDAWVATPIASANIWAQQYQFAHFLHRYYEGQEVAINDIGAAGFYADIRSLDIVGLDDSEIGRLAYRDELGPNTIAQIARQRGVKIAVVYQTWLERFNRGKPPWIKVGTWTINDNYICADATVTFYAVDPAERDALARHLKEYEAELPDSVVTSGYTAP